MANTSFVVFAQAADGSVSATAPAAAPAAETTSAQTAASGAVQAIQFLEDGSLYGTADPRQDGKAVGY